MARPFWGLQGPRRFLEGICKDLRDGNNIVLCLPAHPPRGLSEALLRTLKELPRKIVQLVGTKISGAAPLRVLAETLLPTTADDVRLPLHLASHQALDGSPTLVVVDYLTDTDWPIWSAFLSEYAHACRNAPGDTSLRVLLCLVAHGDQSLQRRLPKVDVTLNHHYYYGAVSRFDMLFYAASVFAELPFTDLQRQLAIATSVQISQWDPEVCDRMATESWPRLLNPRKLLKELAAERDWLASHSARPPSWFAGSADRFGFDERLHSAFLTLKDPTREIDRRLRCAQMAVLLPLVEERRPGLIKQLEHVLPVTYIDLETKEETDRRDMEVGIIAHELRTKNFYRPPHEEVAVLHEVRNKLAHIDAVELSLLEKLEDVLNRAAATPLSSPRPREPTEHSRSQR